MKQLLDTINLNSWPTFVSSSYVPLVGSSRASSRISRGSSSSDKDVKQVWLLAWGATFISSELCCGTELLFSTTINNKCWLPHRVQGKLFNTGLMKNSHAVTEWQSEETCAHPPATHTVWTCLNTKPSLNGLMLSVYWFTISTTRYRLNGLGIESWWGRDFPHPSRPALGPTQPHIIMGTGPLSRG